MTIDVDALFEDLFRKFEDSDAWLISLAIQQTQNRTLEVYWRDYHGDRVSILIYDGHFQPSFKDRFGQSGLLGGKFVSLRDAQIAALKQLIRHTSN